MTLHGLHQVSQRRLQTLPADAIRCFPHQDHRLLNRLVVDAPALDVKPLILSADRPPQQPDDVLAVMTRNRDELVEGPALILPRRCPVAVPDRRQQFPFSHPAHASRHANASRFSVAFYLRQSLPKSNVLTEAMRYNTKLPREEGIYFRRMLIVPGDPEEKGIAIGIEIPHKHQIPSISSMTSLDILRTPSPPDASIELMRSSRP